MSTTQSDHLKSIQDGGKQQLLICSPNVHYSALRDLRDNINLAVVCVRGADFDSNIFSCFLVKITPNNGERAMTEVVHHSISCVESIINVSWMVAANSVLTDILYFSDESVLNMWPRREAALEKTSLVAACRERMDATAKT
ncbi:hypothetical protein E4U58_000625 [Claviceps cyperi]|nr:hypothetical protein E4U58_000625 [Claviceps cyperi]